MDRSAPDYRNLRFCNLFRSEYRYIHLLWGWAAFFLMYYLTERFVPPERCYLVHCPLDDRIPFCEWFVIPYVLWYFLVAGSLAFFLIHDADRFKRLQAYILITQVIAVGMFLLFPTRQDLRPGQFPRENLLTGILSVIYRIDTNTGVFPSLHVALSLGIASAWIRDQTVSGKVRIVLVLLCGLICVSVVFVKQHSVLDALGAVPVCLVAEWAVYLRRS